MILFSFDCSYRLRYAIEETGGVCLADILKRDGLSFELLRKLSYQSDLGIRLKKNLHYFDKEILFAELLKVNRW